MKRSVFIKKICSFLKDSDVVLFGDTLLAGDVLEPKTGCLHFSSCSGLSVSTALGIALTTDKRVFVILTATTALDNLTSIAQVGVLKPKNLFIIIINNINEDGLFDKLLSPIAMFFNMGCQSFNLTKDFELRRDSLIKTFFDRGQGPSVILISAEKDKKSNVCFENNFESFSDFVRDMTIKSALFDPFSEAAFVQSSITASM